MIADVASSPSPDVKVPVIIREEFPSISWLALPCDELTLRLGTTVGVSTLSPPIPEMVSVPVAVTVSPGSRVRTPDVKLRDPAMTRLPSLVMPASAVAVEGIDNVPALTIVEAETALPSSRVRLPTFVRYPRVAEAPAATVASPLLVTFVATVPESMSHAAPAATLRFASISPPETNELVTVRTAGASAYSAPIVPPGVSRLAMLWLVSTYMRPPSPIVTNPAPVMEDPANSVRSPPDGTLSVALPKSMAPELSTAKGHCALPMVAVGPSRDIVPVLATAPGG